MKYTITKLNDKFPKKANRSDRTLKKLHLGSYAETCVDISIKFDGSDIDSDYFLDVLYDKLFDAMYTLPFTETEMQTCGMSRNEYTIMYCIPTSEFNEEFIKERIVEVLRLFSEIEPAFSEVQEVGIVHADAWYGEW